MPFNLNDVPRILTQIMKKAIQAVESKMCDLLNQDHLKRIAPKIIQFLI
jgi:hypothetical protein